MLRATIEELAKSRAKKPWVFALVWLGSIAIFSYHLNENLAYPWFGNPDQDLVFLRDGLRIAQLKTPLYSDHPGLAQMILGAIAHLAWNNHGMAIGDEDWQNIFNIHKIANAFAMATVLACCCEALGNLISKPNATIVGICCALSMGSTTLVYQLRNEFFSAYLFFLGSLIICILLKNRQAQASGVEMQKPIHILVPSACSMLYFMALLAKMQVIPLVGLFCLGVALWGFTGSNQHAKCVVEAFGKSTIFSALWTVALFLLGVQPANLSQAWTIILLTLFPIVFACTGLEADGDIKKANSRISLMGYTPWLIAYTLITRAFRWESISWNPWGMNKYTFPLAGEASKEGHGLWQRVIDGYLLLFERTFDGQSIAIFLSIALPAVMTIMALRSVLRKKKTRINSTAPEIPGLYTLICAASMASVASLRWPVDHYLSYQQPILYLAIAIMAEAHRPLMFRTLSLYALISATIISAKYPSYSHATYVKIPDAQMQSKLSINDQNPSYNPALCASQHAGTEWKGSVVGKACGY